MTERDEGDERALSLPEAYAGINLNPNNEACWPVVMASATRFANADRARFKLSNDDVEEVVASVVFNLYRLARRLPEEYAHAHLRACVRHGAIDHLRAHGRFVPLPDDEGLLSGIELSLIEARKENDALAVDIGGGRVELYRRVKQSCRDADASPYLSWHECFALAGIPANDLEKESLFEDRGDVPRNAALRRAPISALATGIEALESNGGGTLDSLMRRTRDDWMKWLELVESVVREHEGDAPPKAKIVLQALRDVVSGTAGVPADGETVESALWVAGRLRARLPLNDIFALRAFEERRMKIGLTMEGTPLPSGPAGEGEQAPSARRRRGALSQLDQLRILLLRNAEGSELCRLTELLAGENEETQGDRKRIQNRFAQRHKRALQLVDTLANSARDDESLPVALRSGLLVAAAMLHSETRRVRVLREYRMDSLLDRLGGNNAV